MLNEPLIDRLHAMKLTGIAQALGEQRQNPSMTRLSFEERLSLLVDRQYQFASDRALRNRLRFAGLSDSGPSIEGIDYRYERALQPSQLDALITPEWIRQGKSALIAGVTGLGKTYLGLALARQACRNGFRTLATYSPKLFRSLSASELDGSLIRQLKKLASCQLLLIDDFGMEKAEPATYRLFLEVLHDRIGKTATLITSQYAPGSWHAIIRDETVADAITDRLAHAAYRLDLSGDTIRRRLES
ncbi:MAG: DNA replication protein DnaC [Rhodothermales bacterium]|jgi:DNA replication protein DnaC